MEIGAGILLYIIAWVVTSFQPVTGTAETVLFLLAYGALSAATYWEQIKRITKRQFLDENLLMIIATAGAFLIGRHKEAVAAMLFYQVGKLVEEISLSRTEQRLLLTLLENRGNTVPRERLLETVWPDGTEYVEENALSVAVSRLRAKLEDTPSSPVHILNVYGIGYVWK